MDQLTQEEKAKYDMVWRQIPSYRDCSPGQEFVHLFFQGFEGLIQKGQSLADLGCGTARVAKEFLFRGLDVTLVDISPYALDQEIQDILPLFATQLRFVQSCLWDLPEDLGSFDWIYCCDVMEHIPKERVDEVFSQMRERLKIGGYLSICLQEDNARKIVGQPLHLTVKDRDFWEKAILKHFDIASVDLFADDLYFNCCIHKKEQ